MKALTLFKTYSSPNETDIKYLGVKLESNVLWSLKMGHFTGKVDLIKRTVLPALKHLCDNAFKMLVCFILEHTSSNRYPDKAARKHPEKNSPGW